MPFVSAEFPLGGRNAEVSLHTEPSPVPFAAGEDVWWSLGAISRGDVTELLSMSGAVAINGRRGERKSGQKNSPRRKTPP